jgi:uncharacterized caspase-like protein
MRTYIKQTCAFLLTVAIALLVPAMSFGQEKPNLFILSVGVSKYVNKNFEGGVVFSAKDAQDMAESFRSQSGKRYQRVESKVLVDDQATLENIKTAMEWLQKNATADSHVVVYLSGHGGPNSLGAYQYLVHDSHQLIASTRLQGAWLRDRLQKLPGKRFLIMDTCHSGGFDLESADFTTLASCGAKEYSGELVSIQNGFFTRCLLDGLSGKADANFDGTISIAEIEAYVSKNLPEMTKGKQNVTAYRPISVANDFPMMRLGTGMAFAKTGPRINALK